MNPATWWEVFAARFGKRLSDREFEVWEAEIEGEIRECSQAEIIDAIRALSEDKRKGEFKFAPTVEHIIGKVIYHRWQEKREREAADDYYNQSTACACKGSGWVTTCPNFGHYQGGEVDVPCHCERGQLMGRKYYKKPSDHDYHRRLRQFALSG